MRTFDVYPLYDIEIASGAGAWVTDAKGRRYLDFYGGHAVISIGHSHPTYQQMVREQLGRLGFYSNSVLNPLQDQLATQLGRLSGLDDYQLFLVNSGAEANENALKLASFATGKSKVISFAKGFHGRTSAAVNVTDNERIIAPINRGFENIKLPLNDRHAFDEAVREEGVAAVIVEGIQGVAGVYPADPAFLQHLRDKTREHGVLLILDEIQSGYGRSGDFHAFQAAGALAPDLITMAKGMGNGFPIGGVLIHPSIQPSYGMLGTTFGGNHLACAAGLAVLTVMEEEDLLTNARQQGKTLQSGLADLPHVREIRGRGLMIGLELDQPVKNLRKQLLFDHGLFVGSAAQPNTLRLLPPLNVTPSEVAQCLDTLDSVLRSL